MKSKNMKRLLVITLLVCLIISLVGCGSPASQPQDNSKSAAGDSKVSGDDSSSKPVTGEIKETTVQTNIGKNGGEVTVQTGQSIAWDSEKMGGLPQPEGVTVVMSMDMSKIIGKSFAYSYTVTGLTKENNEKYVELVLKSFPEVLTRTVSENEGVLMASRNNYEENVLVAWNKDEESLIQYSK